MPCSMARRAADSAAICAAKGVDFLEPLNPTWPDEAQEIMLPAGSVMDTMVLLNVLLMCACPCATFFRSLRRTFLTPVRLFGGILLVNSGGDRSDAPGSPEPARLAPYWTTSCRPSSCRPRSWACPCEYGRWSGCAGRV